MTQVALKQQDGVLIRTLGWRKLLFRAGHESLRPIQGRQLVLFVRGRVVIFGILSEKREKKEEEKINPRTVFGYQTPPQQTPHYYLAAISMHETK